MTHEELLTDIDTKILLSEHTIYPIFMQALRSVVGLHTEQEVTLPDGEWGIICDHCSEYGVYVLYPCKTIRAIEQELNYV